MIIVRTAIAASLFAALALPADFVSPRMKSGEAEIHTVLMLPAIAEMSKRGIKGSEGMGGEAEEANNQLYTAVAAALSNRGLQVERPFSEEALKADDELKYAVADVQRRFDQVSGQLFKKHKDVRKGRFSLGDSVAVLNARGNADALIVIRADGTQFTRSKAMLKKGVIGMARAGKAEFKSRVALVDARNGDILFLGDYESRGLPKDKTYEKSFLHIQVAATARPQPPRLEPVQAAQPIQTEQPFEPAQPVQIAQPVQPEPAIAAPAQENPVFVNAPEPVSAPGPATISFGTTIDEVEMRLGKPRNIVDLGTKKLYLYPNLKITFMAGKVSDVE